MPEQEVEAARNISTKSLLRTVIRHAVPQDTHLASGAAFNDLCEGPKFVVGGVFILNFVTNISRVPGLLQDR